MSTELPGTYIEWRVTADQVGHHRDLPPYDFTWSKRINPRLCDADGAEAAARAFVRLLGVAQSLTNIQVHRRTVTIGNWENVDG